MVAPYASPESACPGLGLALTDSGQGIQILGAQSVTYDSRFHAPMPYDTSLNSGQGGYFHNKTLTKVLTSAQRAALAGGDLYAGLTVLESDTLIEYEYTGSVWVISNVLGAWITGTPTWTNVTVGNATTNAFYYHKAGRLLTFEIRFVLGTTSSITGQIKVAIPGTYPSGGNHTAARSRQRGIHAEIDDAGTVYPLRGRLTTTTSIDLFTEVQSGTYPTETATSNTVPVTMATGDAIYIFGQVELTA